MIWPNKALLAIEFLLVTSRCFPELLLGWNFGEIGKLLLRFVDEGHVGEQKWKLPAKLY